MNGKFLVTVIYVIGNFINSQKLTNHFNGNKILTNRDSGNKILTNRNSGIQKSNLKLQNGIPGYIPPNQYLKQPHDYGDGYRSTTQRGYQRNLQHFNIYTGLPPRSFFATTRPVRRNIYTQTLPPLIYRTNEIYNQQLLSNRVDTVNHVADYDWSKWGAWSKCSVPCNRGIKKRKRKCNRVGNIATNNDEKLEENSTDFKCVGNNEDFKECNRQPCLSAKELNHRKQSARKKQCSTQNRTPYQGEMHTWLPYLREGLDECQLTCMPVGYRMFKSFGHVLDGTICGVKQGYGCTKGKCVKYKEQVYFRNIKPILNTQRTSSNNSRSYNSKYNSKNNSKSKGKKKQILNKNRLKKISRYFQRRDTLQVGYNRGFLIPFGAKNITIYEKSPSRNYIALKLANDYILNGNWKISLSTEFSIDDVTVSYIINANESKPMEKIFIDGPLAKDLYVEILYQQDVIDLHFDYLLLDNHGNSSKQNFLSHYPPARNSIRYLPQANSDRQQYPLVSKNVNPLLLRVNPLIPRVSPLQPRGNTGKAGYIPVQQKQLLQRQIPLNNNQIIYPLSQHKNPYVYKKPANVNNQYHGNKLPANLYQGNKLPANNRFLKQQQQRNGDDFQYVISNRILREDGNKQRHQVTYKWQIGGITRCSKRCDTGEQEFTYRCFEQTDIRSGKFVKDENCVNIKVPVTRKRACNQQSCPARWVITDWSACSKTCGNASVQIRTAVCKQKQPFTNQSDNDIHTDVSRCKDIKKPLTLRRCLIAPCHFVWKEEAWGECSSTCGKGQQIRNVYCQHHNGNEIPDKHCGTTKKPLHRKECFLRHCDVSWYASEWGMCSRACDNGYQKRRVICASIDGVKLPEYQCNIARKPLSTRSCKGSLCSDVIWVTTEWSKCLNDCGEGYKYRQLFCLHINNNKHAEHVDESKCHHLKRPTTKEVCESSICQPLWYSSQWKQCNAECGHGTKERNRICLSNDEKIARGCMYESRPTVSEICIKKTCFEASKSTLPTKTTKRSDENTVTSLRTITSTLTRKHIDTTVPSTTSTSTKRQTKSNTKGNSKALSLIDIYLRRKFNKAKSLNNISFFKPIVTALNTESTSTTRITRTILPTTTTITLKPTTTTTPRTTTQRSTTKTTKLKITTKKLDTTATTRKTTAETISKILQTTALVPKTTILKPAKPKTTQKIQTQKKFQRRKFSSRLSLLHLRPYANLSKRKCFLDLQVKAYCTLIAFRLKFCKNERFYKLCCKTCNSLNA